MTKNVISNTLSSSSTCSVPPQRVLRHHRRADHLRAVAPAVVAVRRSTSAKQRPRLPPFAHLLDVRARPLVRLALPAVPPRQPEHARSVRRRASHNAHAYSNRAGRRRRAAARTGVLRIVRLVSTTSIVAANVSTGRLAAAARSQGRAADLQGNRRVNHGHQSLHRVVRLLIQPRVRVVQHRRQRLLLIRRDVRQCHRRNVPGVLGIVVRPKRKHRHILRLFPERVHQAHRQIEEDLR